jgi:prolipoprotein diacylglyceryltransferase
MYPSVDFFGIQIYTFGFILSCTWLLFFALLHRFSAKKWIVRPIFTDIVTFTISIVFFARLFYILVDWVNEKFILESLVRGHFIDFLRQFFIPPNYLFSLVGGIIGFFIVFFTKTRHTPQDRSRYLEAIVMAFLGASLLWFLGAFLGWQVYGVPFQSPISVTYDHLDSIVKDRAPLFPLAIFYIMCITGIIVFLRKFQSRHHLPDGFIGFLGIGLFSLLVFFWEFLSGARKDIFYDLVLSLSGGTIGLSLNQIGALVGIIIALLWLMQIAQKKI